MKILGGVKFSIGLLVLVLCLGTGLTNAQTSAFNYQGRLTEGSAPANGIYDLEFRAFDALTAGTQAGTTKSFSDVTVSSGILNVNVDFGTSVFPGADRWIEVRVRPGASNGPFTTLSPRQPVTPTPYALHSLDASKLSGVAADQFLQATDSRLLTELSTASGFMVAGANNALFCSEGTCRVIAVNGVTGSSSAQCGGDGCMISGGSQAVYCNKEGCITTAVTGATAGANTVRCGADGCMIPGSNQVVYCGRSACQTLVVNGVAASATTVRCGQDGCIIPGANQVIYCSRGTCRTEAATGVAANSATAVCGTRGCMAPATDQALYCFQGSCQLLVISGVTASTNVASFVK